MKVFIPEISSITEDTSSVVLLIEVMTYSQGSFRQSISQPTPEALEKNFDCSPDVYCLMYQYI
jgi:hypothetical protein